MAKARKLPSGRWRALVYAGKDAAGKRLYESFTADTRKEAEFQAAEFALTKNKADKPEDMTVGEAIDRYIAMKDAVLSPSTVREYKAERNHRLQGIMDVMVSKVTQEIVQREVNKDAAICSPKSVKNAHGLLSAALGVFRPELTLRTTLPQKTKPVTRIPTKSEVKKLLAASEGTNMHLPILLASQLGLRRSEICGLKWDAVNLDAGTVRISQAKVYGSNKDWVIKQPKSYTSNRTLSLPPPLLAILRAAEKNGDYIVGIEPGTITHRFAAMIEELGIEPCRFHDLRHYFASVMLALNIPDKYAMERMGHASNDMLKTVYQHTMQERADEADAAISEYFSAD